MEGDWEEKKKRVITEEMTYEDFKQMQAQWLNSGRMVWFVYGNVPKDKAVATIDQAKNILKLTPVNRESLVDIRTLDVLPGQIHRVDFQVEDPKNDNSCLISYWQLGLLGESPNAMRNLLLNKVLH